MIVYINRYGIRAIYCGPSVYWVSFGQTTISLGYCDSPEQLLEALRQAATILQLDTDTGPSWITQPDQLPD